ncbi:MAG: AMP-binding protein [Bacteroidota bacterium]
MNVQSVAYRICEQLNSKGDKTAIVIDGQSYSYGFIKKRVAAFGRPLQEQSEVEQCIGLHLQNTIECYIGLIAIMISGRTFVPLNEDFGQRQLLHIIESANVSKVIQSAQTDFFEEFKAKSNFDTIQVESELLDEPLTCIQSTSAYVLFTSGSTGSPKGVPITHDNLNHFIFAMTTEMEWSLNEDDKFLQPFSLSFDLFVMCVYLPLFLGASLYTTPLEKRALNSAALMDSEGITVCVLVPSSMRIINNISSSLTFKSLRYAFFCGEPLYESDLKSWNKLCPNSTSINIYGPTEGAVVCMRFILNQENVNQVESGIIPIGIPFGKNEISFHEDEKGTEILIGGPQVFSGYMGDVESPFIEKNERNYYRTGDYCKKDKWGNLIFIGRKDEQLQLVSQEPFF